MTTDHFAAIILLLVLAAVIWLWLQKPASRAEKCRAPHCWYEYGTPCSNCPLEPNSSRAEPTWMWPRGDVSVDVIIGRVHYASNASRAEAGEKVRHLLVVAESQGRLEAGAELVPWQLASAIYVSATTNHPLEDLL